MKKFIFGLVIVMAMARPVLAASYSEQLTALRKTGTPQEIQKFIADSASSNQDNPEYFVVSANYWYAVSQEVSVTTKAAEKGDFVVADQKTGKAVGSVSSAGRVNPQILSNGVDLLKEGFKKFPLRLDVGIGLAYMLRAQKQADECLATLKQVLATATSHPGEIRWKAAGNPPDPWNKFLPESLQNYATAFYKSNSKKGDALCQELCEAIIKAYPDHPYAYNNLAALSNAHGDKKGCLQYLQTALEKAPDDTLVMFNLGDEYQKLGDKASAKKYYELILTKNPPDDLKAEAQKALGAL